MNFIANKADQFIKSNIKKSKCLIDVDPYSLVWEDFGLAVFNEWLDYLTSEPKNFTIEF